MAISLSALPAYSGRFAQSFAERSAAPMARCHSLIKRCDSVLRPRCSLVPLAYALPSFVSLIAQLQLVCRAMPFSLA
eukprot:6982163-Prymnesium_polylepis.1